MEYTTFTIKAVILLVALLLARQEVSATQSWVSSLYQPGNFHLKPSSADESVKV